MKTRIHVNQHVIRSNRKNGKSDPVITVKQGRRNRYAMEVQLTGPGRVVYSPCKPLSCGAEVWIETDHPVKLVREKRCGTLRS